MRIIKQTWDLDDNTISDLPPIKRGDSFLHELTIIRDKAPFVLPDGFSMIFDAKPENGGGGEALILAMAYSWDVERGLYVGKVVGHSDELDVALGIGGTEKASLVLKGEVTCAPPTEEEEEGDWTTSPTFDVTVENDIHRGPEGVPVSTVEPVNFYTKAQSDARFVNHDVEDAWVQLGELGFTFDAERSIMTLTKPGGGSMAWNVTVVPGP